MLSSGNFYTNFLTTSPYFRNVTRVADPNYLEPVTRAAVLAIIADAEAEGHPLILYETYRSPSRQQFLYQQSVTELMDVGCHGFGLAADLVKDLYGQPSWEGDFSFLGVLAKKHGLVWGGSWEFMDDFHVQRIRVSDQDKLLSGTWYPDQNYRALAEEVPNV
jgi:hypothetical protein